MKKLMFVIVLLVFATSLAAKAHAFGSANDVTIHPPQNPPVYYHNIDPVTGRDEVVKVVERGVKASRSEQRATRKEIREAANQNRYDMLEHFKYVDNQADARAWAIHDHISYVATGGIILAVIAVALLALWILAMHMRTRRQLVPIHRATHDTLHVATDTYRAMNRVVERVEQIPANVTAAMQPVAEGVAANLEATQATNATLRELIEEVRTGFAEAPGKNGEVITLLRAFTLKNVDGKGKDITRHPVVIDGSVRTLRISDSDPNVRVRAKSTGHMKSTDAQILNLYYNGGLNGNDADSIAQKNAVEKAIASGEIEG